MRIHTSLIASVIAALLLAACAKPLEVASITEIQPKNGAKGIDIYEPRRRAGDALAPEFAGDQLLEVRTYTYKDGQGEIEVPGASCTVSAAEFSATTRTPAKVRVPIYRAQSSQLAVQCEMDGFQKRMVTVAAFDVTRSQRMASSGGGGLIGIVAVAAVDALADNSKNNWAYPVARVVLEPAGKKTASAQ